MNFGQHQDIKSITIHNGIFNKNMQRITLKLTAKNEKSTERMSSSTCGHAKSNHFFVISAGEKVEDKCKRAAKVTKKNKKKRNSVYTENET